MSQPKALVTQSHRVYWQQRLLGGSTSSSNRRNSSNNNLITGSAAVKIAPTAKASDLTNLLRKTLHLDSIDAASQKGRKTKTTPKDALVLVGTLRSVPDDYVVFEHEQQETSTHQDETEEQIFRRKFAAMDRSISISITGDDFHVVKTLRASDLCLTVLQTMEDHLQQRQRGIDKYCLRQENKMRPIIAPQTRWYYVPDTSQSQSQKQPVMSSCLELDGYITSLDNDDDDDSDSDNDSIDEKNEDLGFGASSMGGDEDLLQRALAPFLDEDDAKAIVNSSSDPNDDNTNAIQNDQAHNIDNRTKGRHRRKRRFRRVAQEWRNYLQISRSHANPASDPNPPTHHHKYSSTLSGFLLKRSPKDPHVWKRHYCILTEDDFWYVPRIVRPDELCRQSGDADEQQPPNMLVRTIPLAPYHGRIRLVDALLLDNDKTGQPRDGFEVVDGLGTTHEFRSQSPALANDWRKAIQGRSQEAFENSLLQHAGLILKEETVAKNGRWKTFLLAGETTTTNEKSLRLVFKDNDPSISCPRTILQFGLEVSEYKEGCRQMQSLLLSSSTNTLSSGTTNAATTSMEKMIQKLLRELWGEASALLESARSIYYNTLSTAHNDRDSGSTSSMETLCDHVEFVITQTRRKRKTTVDPGKGGDEDSIPAEAEAVACLGEYPHHQRDPPPIDLFDGLWSELRTLG